MLAWDGLRFPLPPAMEAVELLPGYLRLAGREQSLELRFAPEKRVFDPGRDGRRLQRGAVLPATGLAICAHPAALSLPGALYGGGRLYVYRLTGGGLVALLHGRPVAVEEVVARVAAMAWTPPESWRQWCFLDVAFDTPPLSRLQRVRIVPGSCALTWQRGGTALTLARLAAADVLLAGAALPAVAERVVASIAKAKIARSDEVGNRLEFTGRTSFLARMLPFFSGFGQGLRGCLGHDRRANRLLLVVERGRPLPEEDYRRVVESYVSLDQG